MVLDQNFAYWYSPLPVDDVDADGGVDVVRERVLPDEGRGHGQDVGRVELLVHRRGLK